MSEKNEVSKNVICMTDFLYTWHFWIKLISFRIAIERLSWLSWQSSFCLMKYPILLKIICHIAALILGMNAQHILSYLVSV